MKNSHNHQHDKLVLTGIRENNLKNLDLNLKHDSITVISGVSGSGKSTLAFDTLYAEGGRRYIETFSPYTRQFLDRLHKPDFDSISGVRPALALEQANRIINSRSTVGTVTEINDYLKVIFSNLSTINCSSCGGQVTRETISHVYAEVEALSKKYPDSICLILFSVNLSGAASAKALSETLLSEGYVRFFENNNIRQLEDLSEADLEKNTKLEIVAERIKLNRSLSKNASSRIRASIKQAYASGSGKLKLVLLKSESVCFDKIYSSELYCAKCDKFYPEPKAAFFSFNSPLGACTTCRGFGYELKPDPDKIVANQNLSIEEKAIIPWNSKSKSRQFNKFLDFCKAEGISTTKPFKSLSAKSKQKIFEGKGSFKGIYGWFERLKKKQYKMHIRVLLSRFRGQFLCSSCNGARIKPQALNYQIEGKNISDIWNCPISSLLPFFSELQKKQINDESTEVALSEVLSRLSYLEQIGLGYLTLNRQSRTLSGGESQRVNLTSILGARLVNTLLVLDEPTIGLHQRDTHRLIQTISQLKSKGNSLVVVEHDEEVIKSADEVIDLGPTSGERGGEIIYQGNLPGLKKSSKSLTAKYLFKKPTSTRKKSSHLKGNTLKICNAKQHNLKGIDVAIPLNNFVVLCGVSGSGKTTLITKSLVGPFEALKNGGLSKDLKGLEHISDIVLIDQSPVGKTPRSNPGTYTKAWELIRECLASTEDAERLGLTKSSFSFNVEGGRCTDCKGAGQHKIEMQFLADVYVACETCGGNRFQDKVLGIKFQNKSVADFLNMSVAEVAEFFNNLGEEAKAKEICKRIEPLVALGLGYLRLGHPLSSLSGGEAQRIKLASYLKEKSTDNVLFILDEPTTGLHPHNIVDLLSVFERLKEAGHSLLVIEHNLDVIKQADWLIELGPEGGESGGHLVAEGEPEKLLKQVKLKTPTLEALRSSGKSKASKTSSLKKKKAAHGEAIEIVGASHHNLKSISTSIPLNKIVAVTGVSGSGKSTLAFDLIFSEGQRRYIDCLSPYARQFMKQLERAEVEQINNLPPTIAVSQKTSAPLGISTVATVTEVNQYLRLLFSKVGIQHCPKHNEPISTLSPEKIVELVIAESKNKPVYLFSPVISGRKGFHNEVFARAHKAELFEARVDGTVRNISPDLRLERHKLHWISLLVASLKNPAKQKDLLLEAIEQCLLLGNGTVELSIGSKLAEPVIFSSDRVCPKCKRGFRMLDPQDFSFRSKRGLCKTCSGRGKVEKRKQVRACPDCKGARIAETGRNVFVSGKNIHQLCLMNAKDLRKFLNNAKFDSRLEPILYPILTELKHRLDVICKVGLEYLSLDRDSSSLSGGEAQRLRLARTLGSPLSGVCYVLDEPTIGLHPQDQELLGEILTELRDAGNSVIVVEHDEDVIRQADYVVDIGPRGGARGGQVVFTGTPKDLTKAKNSLTAQALNERETKTFDISDSKVAADKIWLKGVNKNNISNLDVSIPKQAVTVVCGVSGAGKSSLVHGSLVPAIFEEFEGKKKKAEDLPYKSISGLSDLDRFIEIDQTPLGKTSSSTPASYLGILTDLRKLYASLPEAVARGYDHRHFSYNTGAGRCESCEGKGFIKVPMSFLPDAVSLCEACDGNRYSPDTEEILYNGISMGNLLKKTMDEALEILTNHSRIKRSLQYVSELGLGYITLGQPSHTLSGGEAQRLKIATELGKRDASNTLYILDEPTIGLHMTDIDKLLSVLRKLVAKGNTVLLIEHDLDIIKAADYLIEMGPGAADKGGKLVFSGSPRELLRQKKKTPTALVLK